MACRATAAGREKTAGTGARKLTVIGNESIIYLEKQIRGQAYDKLIFEYAGPENDGNA